MDGPLSMQPATKAMPRLLNCYCKQELLWRKKWRLGWVSVKTVFETTQLFTPNSTRMPPEFLPLTHCARVPELASSYLLPQLRIFESVHSCDFRFDIVCFKWKVLSTNMVCYHSSVRLHYASWYGFSSFLFPLYMYRMARQHCLFQVTKVMTRLWSFSSEEKLM